MARDPRIVYSTTDGDLRRSADSRSAPQRGGTGGSGGTGSTGRVKVRREISGRRGKAVTTIAGVPLDDQGLRSLAGRLKKRCGVGGSVKNGVIEIQGDRRETVVEVLRAEGYDPVLAGG